MYSIAFSFFTPPVPPPIRGNAIDLKPSSRDNRKAFLVDSLIDLSVATQNIFKDATWIIPL